MKVIEIRYELTRQGPKQYEADKFGATAILEDGDSLIESMASLKAELLEGNSTKNKSSVKIKGTLTLSEDVKVEEKVEEKKDKVELKLEPAEIKKEVAEEKSEKKEVKPEQVTEKTTETKEVESEKNKKKQVETTAKKPKAEKVVDYDGVTEVQKQLLGAMLDEKIPGWRKMAVLPKAKEVSLKMVGKPFLDVEGNIIPSFIEEYLNLYNA